MFGSGTRGAEVVRERPGNIWSPAQLVALVIGGGAIVFGALALADTGLDLGHIDFPHDVTLGFHTTPLLALIEIAWGALMVIAALRPVAGRALMVLLGTAASVFGVLILLDAWQHRFHDWFGVHDDNGWLILAAGVVTLLASFVLPVITTPGTRVVRERSSVGS
ncbi:MAG TPA: hypothetical protein VIH82_05130 [Acidimicrobiia bacterium]|jgi:hypothetical protein